MKTHVIIFAGLVFALMIGLYGCGYTTIKKETKSQSPPIVKPPFEWPKVNYNLPSKTPDNFGFRFVYGYSDFIILDTFNSTLRIQYTRHYGGRVDTTIFFKLPKEPLDSIYTKMVNIDFFNYPIIETAEETKKHPCMMHITYKVRADTIWKNLYSYACDGPYKQKAEEIQQLNSLIWRLVESSPNYKGLPKLFEPRMLN